MSRRACKFTVTDITRIVQGAYRASVKEGVPFIVEVHPDDVIVKPKEDRGKEGTWDDVA